MGEKEKKNAEQQKKKAERVTQRESHTAHIKYTYAQQQKPVSVIEYQLKSERINEWMREMSNGKIPVRISTFARRCLLSQRISLGAAKEERARDKESALRACDNDIRHIEYKSV